MSNTLKFVKELRKLKGAMTERVNPYRQENLIKSSSPSLNWIFGHGHGLPFGHGVMLWGEPKCGKSLVTYDLIASMHQQYPDAIAIKFDTEFRDESQLTDAEAATWGVDLDRLVVIQTNKSGEIFDQIEQDINGLIQDGAKVKLIAIDSISGIQGNRDANAASVEDNQMGDHAQTVKKGLKRILPIQKRNNVALICSTHATAEMDQWEVKRNGKSKAAASYGIRHHCEYFVNVSKVVNATGKTDLQGNELIDKNRRGMDDKGEKTGHKITVWMQESTVGCQDRVGQFTFDYKRGIINQHEELFLLGKRWNVVKKPSSVMYSVADKQFRGEPATIAGIAASPELQKFIADGLLAAETAEVAAPVAQTPEEAEAEFEALTRGNAEAATPA
jgi:hypothetical protein